MQRTAVLYDSAVCRRLLDSMIVVYAEDSGTLWYADDFWAQCRVTRRPGFARTVPVLHQLSWQVSENVAPVPVFRGGQLKTAGGAFYVLQSRES